MSKKTSVTGRVYKPVGLAVDEDREFITVKVEVSADMPQDTAQGLFDVIRNYFQGTTPNIKIKTTEADEIKIDMENPDQATIDLKPPTEDD